LYSATMAVFGFLLFNITGIPAGSFQKKKKKKLLSTFNIRKLTSNSIRFLSIPKFLAPHS